MQHFAAWRGSRRPALPGDLVAPTPRAAKLAAAGHHAVSRFTLRGKPFYAPSSRASSLGVGVSCPPDDVNWTPISWSERRTTRHGRLTR